MFGTPRRSSPVRTMDPSASAATAPTPAVAAPVVAASRAAPLTIPIGWQLAAVAFAATSVVVGVLWDISWHMSIGRDTFWTPAHLAIYTGGAVAGLVCGAAILLLTAARRRGGAVATAGEGGTVTVFRYFQGPLGGWLCVWGAIAMLTSGPFDDWWHNAYGLDVEIISPPHTLLFLGFTAILVGAQLMAVARQTRAVDAGADRPAAAWVVAYTSGLLLTMIAIFAWQYQGIWMMHRPLFYQVAAAVYPLFLGAGAVAIRLRFPATAMAGVYTAAMLLQGWVLPLFAAEPLLGPIRRDLTHMVPLDFPLMLLPAAFAFDLALHALRERGAWLRAIGAGVAFLAVLLVAQWPLADVLVSDTGRSAFFFADNFSYSVPETARRVVRDAGAGELLPGLAIAGVLAIVATRLGLGWGNWLKAVRR
jgi:hypothetical protein